MIRKLTDDQVEEARRLHADGMSYRAIGERFAMSREGIRLALNLAARVSHRAQDRARVANMTPEQREARRALNRVANMTPEQREAKRIRNLLASPNRKRLTPEQREAKRARYCVANLTPEQLEVRRAQRHVANMTPEQVEVRREDWRRRRALRCGVIVEEIPPAFFLALEGVQGGRCPLCGEVFGSGPREVDHVRPHALGGEHAPGNLILAHARCNRSKGNRLIEDYLATLDGATALRAVAVLASSTWRACDEWEGALT